MIPKHPPLPMFPEGNTRRSAPRGRDTFRYHRTMVGRMVARGASLGSALGRWWWVAASAIAIVFVLGAAACGLPIASGKYKARALRGVAARVPIEVRSVTVLEANRDIVDNSMTPVAFSPRETERIQHGLRDAIEADLRTSGPFRAPLPGERAYQLDVHVESLSMPARGASAGLGALHGALLGVGLLAGIPYGVLGQEGAAVFHLYAPDGTTLVHEVSADVRKSFAIGLYYGRKKPIGEAAAPLVRQFKRSVAGDVEPVLAMRPVQMKHPASASAGAALASSAAPDAAAAAGPTIPATPPVEYIAAAPQPATYVLSIGIDRYRDAPPAEGAEADARRVDGFFASTFHVPDDHRRLLVGDRATRSDIDKGLRWLAARAKKGTRVIVYFSGHGAPDAAKGTPYVVPYDGDANDLEGTAIAMAEIDRRLGNMPARDAVLIVDACFSGQGDRSVLARGARPLRPVAEVRPQARVIRLSAASGSEIASATDSGDGGIFTRYLLEALGSGRADVDGDGQITLAELQTWLVPRVRSAAKSRSRAQTPQFSAGKKHGDPADVVLGWGYPTR